MRGRFINLLLIPLALRLRTWADGVLQQNEAREEPDPPAPPSDEPSTPPAHWLERVSSVPPSQWIGSTAENVPAATTTRGKSPQHNPARLPQPSGKRMGESPLRLQKTRPPREAAKPAASASQKATPPALPLERSSIPKPVVSSTAPLYGSTTAAHRESTTSYSVNRPEKRAPDPSYARLMRGKAAQTRQAEPSHNQLSRPAPPAEPQAPAPRPVNLLVNLLDDETTGTPQPELGFPLSPLPTRRPDTYTDNRAVVERQRSSHKTVDAAPFLNTSTQDARSLLHSRKGSQEREGGPWRSPKTTVDPAGFPASMPSNPWPELPEISSTPNEELEETIQRLVSHWKLEREQTGRTWSE